jgi:hypothetical protein
MPDSNQNGIQWDRVDRFRGVMLAAPTEIVRNTSDESAVSREAPELLTGAHKNQEEAFCPPIAEFHRCRPTVAGTSSNVNEKVRRWKASIRNLA